MNDKRPSAPYSGWISCEQRPPIGEEFGCFFHSVEVLFTDGSGQWVGYLQTWEDDEYDPVWKMKGPDGWIVKNVTFWMPTLPLPGEACPLPDPRSVAYALTTLRRLVFLHPDLAKAVGVLDHEDPWTLCGGCGKEMLFADTWAPGDLPLCDKCDTEVTGRDHNTGPACLLNPQPCSAWISRGEQDPPEDGERIIVFSPCYPKGHEMRYRIIDARFFKIVTEATHFQILEPSAQANHET